MNYALFGFDYNVTDNLDTEKPVFKPFYNKSKLDKNDLLLVYPNIETWHQESIVLEPSTWDKLIERSKIDLLTINAYSGVDHPGHFMLKLDSITSPSIDFLGYTHLPFAKSITKFYISNPTQEPLVIDILCLESKSVSDKINSNLYKKTDNLLYWHIKHNLGRLPSYAFLDFNGNLVEPEYTLQLYEKNEIVFHFTTGFQGYLLFSDFVYKDFDTYDSVWEFVHGLDRFPTILVLDTFGQPLSNYTVVYDSQQKITISFTNPQAGKLILY